MRWRHLIAVLVAAALAVSWTSSAAASASPRGLPSSTRADPGDSTAQVQVGISSMTPLTGTSGATLTVTGTLRNTSGERLRDVGVRLAISSAPIADAAEAFGTLDGPSDRAGTPVVQRPGYVSLDPGGSTDFTLSVPLDQVGLESPGTYVVTAESVDGSSARLGAASTLLPWFPAGSVAAPTRLVFLWPVMGLPARDAENVFTNPAVAAEVNPGGRLAATVALGKVPGGEGLSWVIDPQTLQSASLLARPHRQTDVGTLDTDGVEATADAGAAQWVQQLRQVTGAPADVTAAAYAYPDAPAEVAGGLLSDLVLATTTSADLLGTQLGRTVAGGFAWPPDGRLDQLTLNALRGAGVRHVVLAEAGLQGAASSPLVQLTTDSGPITGIVADSDLSVALRVVQDRPMQQVAARQTLLAVLALAAVNNPGEALVAAPGVDWRPPIDTLSQILAALPGSTFARLQPLQTLLSSGGGSPGAAGTGADQMPMAELAPYVPLQAQISPAQLQGVTSAGDLLSDVGAITVQPGESLRNYREALLRCLSAFWRADPATGTQVLGRTSAQINALADKVRISSAGTVSFPGEEGRVPVTVSNDLDVPVKVGLTLTATPAYRIQPQAVTDLTIPPGERSSLEVPVSVVGSEPLVVTAQLLTPDGRPYGAGSEFLLRTAAYSHVAGVAVWIAAGLLVLMAAVSIIRRVRRRGRDASQPEGGEHA